MSDTIRELQLKILALRNELDELEEVMKDYKYVQWQYIEDNAREMGLTNETRRKLALDSRLQGDETYVGFVKRQKELRSSIDLLSIDEQFEQRKFKRWYISWLCGGETLESPHAEEILAGSGVQ